MFNTPFKIQVPLIVLLTFVHSYFNLEEVYRNQLFGCSLFLGIKLKIITSFVGLPIFEYYLN